MLFQPRNPRRGVLLLVVMALLALMATVTMTFVLVSGVQMRSARGTALADLDTNSHEALLDGAMDQLLRGAEDPSSPIWTHSLLEDLYGYDTRLGPTTGFVADTPSQPVDGSETMIEMYLEFDNPRLDPAKPAVHPNISPGFYDGRLLTFVTGPLTGVTRRIVRSIPQTMPAARITLQTMSFGGGAPNLGDKFIINDRPFDGTGFGLGLKAALMAGEEIADGDFDNTIDHGLTSGGITRPRALLPNHGRVANSDTELFDPQYPDPAGLGGADEDYDAPDYQNMHLAVMVANPASPIFGTKVIKPSFLDPALLNHFLGMGAANRPTAGSAAERDLARKLLFRPLVSDHPGFIDANPAFDTVDWFKQGPWDVDNDGNGDPDSIWMDLGSPVQTDASGRQYKPLYAILCLDLDGRLNLNAHGSPAHLVRNSLNWPKTEFVGPFANRSGKAQLPIGQGYGPADIVLNQLFKSVAPGSTTPPPYEPYELYYLLHGNPDRYGDDTFIKLAGRYAEEHLLNSTSLNIPPMPGRTSQWTKSLNWGIDGEDDDLDGTPDNFSERALDEVVNGMYDDNFPPPPVGSVDPLDDSPDAEFRGDAMASVVNDGTDARGAYGTPADINGNGAVALDLYGNPIYISHGEGGDAIDDPYEMDLTRNEAERRRGAVRDAGKLAEADAPFTPADLEVLLRIYDADVGTLASRLFELAPDTFVNRPGATNAAAEREFLRGIFTTESWDTPIANTMMGIPELLSTNDPFKIRGSNLLNEFYELFGPADPDQRKVELRRGLYPRFFDGLKFDLNRPFGNAVDDDGDGVVDEPGELETLWVQDYSAAGARFDYNNDRHAKRTGEMEADLIEQSNLARQAMARHLYTLAMMLRNVVAHLSGTVEITERELAQWAINVVDFRDRDSIMTAFEYDTNPLNGWTVDGDLATTDTEAAVVWGVERPELLITETIAGHDRGTDDDAANGGTALSGDTGSNYDQVARPEGWVAIELYNPQSITSPNPAELYDDQGLELSRRSGDLPTGSPVWRMAFGSPDPTDHPEFKDTDVDRDLRHEPVLNLDAAAEASEMGNIERTVYFTDSAPSYGDAGVEYYRALSSDVSIGPGRYAVIASQGVEANGTPVAPVNDLTVGRHYAASARPRLNLEVNSSSTLGEPNWLDVESDGMTDAYPLYEGGPGGPPVVSDEQIRAPISIVIDKPYDAAGGNSRRMSVSEPVNGYPNSPTNLAATPDDTPWDEAADEPWFGVISPQPEYGTANIGGYTRVYLQRLANPTRDFNAATNPYITVDSMPIDLWVYNSSAAQAAGAAMPVASEEPGDIRSRERIGNADLVTPAPLVGSAPHDTEVNIWRQWAATETAGLNQAPAATDGELHHTLGYLNSAWHTPRADAADHRWWTPQWFQTEVDALANGKYAFSGADEEYYTGAPLTPAPWLAWNDRPFISKYELMMVPKSSPAELLAEFSTRDNSKKPYDTDEFGEYSSDLDGEVVGHLLNFFYRSDKTGATDRRNDFYRIFEFVDVPSRFSGLEEMLSPAAFEGEDADPGAETVFGWDDSTIPKRSFSPPFNYLSKYREPGKVNINTVFDDGSTWRAILGGFDGYSGAPNWNTIQESRRGYLPGTAILDVSGNPNLDISTPTLMARPFRSFSGGYFAPTDALRHEGIESTLLRSDPSDPDQPLLALTSATEDTDTSKNPYFRYQLINRLSNMVTTRSNVYAVWITVGYFEVEPIDRSDYLAPTGNYTDEEIDRVFPDGYRLKGELGADTGEIERHRAFYMVDRLVPVAFERGKTHNTRKTIRLRTMIE